MATAASKIYSRTKLIPVIAKLKKLGKKIGVTNGAFDLLHAGHVKFLADAKKLCDILVVSINTDESVQLYKDPRRPINSQKDRAFVVSGLTTVDYVIFHNERRMRDTLLALKPDLYIKGGDYSPDSLTSKDVLDEWGGKIAFISLLPNRSTTAVIEKIAGLYANKPVAISRKKDKSKRRVVFLDRDGVINKSGNYVHEKEKFIFLPHVFEGLKKIQDLGYDLVIVTNQAGIGLGFFTKEDFFSTTSYMMSMLYKQGILLSKIYYCPHNLTDQCNCRKPKTGLFERAQKDLNIDMDKSWMIGNRDTDMQAGKLVGCKTILIGKHKAVSDFRAKNLIDAASLIKNNS